MNHNYALYCPLKIFLFQDSNLKTVNLIAIVVFFLIGEVPGHLLSKKAAAVMLFAGDQDATFDERFLLARKVASVLSALNSSINFLLYFVMHSPFRSGLRALFYGAEISNKSEVKDVSVESGETRESQIDVLVITDKFEISLIKKFMQLTGFVHWKAPW